MNIILMSQSPRRKEILGKIIKEFDILYSDIDETFSDNFDLITNVMSVCKKKLKTKIDTSNSLIISADTIVVIEDYILGKPKSRQEAQKYLKLLSNKEHKVITAYSLKYGEKILCNYSTSFVKFRKLDQDTINYYLNTNEWQDKAGGYGIQEKGSLLVEKIRGDYFNIVGLPITSIIEDLKKIF